MVPRTIKARFKDGMIEPLEKLDIDDGKEIMISIVEVPNEDEEKTFINGINASFGGWKDKVDCEELIKNIYNDRLISTRPKPEL
jgi:predicted DNA-binding antitoxin AbrB/MazE fold protein